MLLLALYSTRGDDNASQHGQLTLELRHQPARALLAAPARLPKCYKAEARNYLAQSGKSAERPTEPFLGETKAWTSSKSCKPFF